MAIVVLVACLLAPAVVRADSVYLKNGRILHASDVQVLEEEGQVVLQQGANRVVIPLSIVERIVEDAEESETLQSGTAEEPAPEAAPPAEEGEAEEGEAAAGEEAAEAPPEETRAYWQDQVRAIEEEKAELQESLQELRREERAFLFSHRSTADTKAKIDAVQLRLAELDQAMEDLRLDARRRGIPPGWLRLDPRPRDSGESVGPRGS